MTLRLPLLSLALVTIAGCGTPPALPALAPTEAGTLVHLSNDDPSLPVALYRADLDRTPRTSGVVPRAAVSGSGRVAFAGDNESHPDDVPRYILRLVCLAPCDQRVEDPTDGLYLGGEGIRPSARFHLPEHEASVHISASPKGATRSTVGTVLVPVGSVSLLLGLLLVPAIVSDVQQHLTDPTDKIVGGSLLGAGVALLAVGLPLLLTGKTSYTVAPGAVAWRF